MNKTGICSANILFPVVSDLTAFSVIACDQFTSEKKYWQELEKLVGDKKSILNLILPEAYLEDNKKARIEKINNNIVEYLNSGVFKTLEKGYILTIRKTPFVERRIGIIGAVDLDEYEYSNKSSSLIRSTEGVVESRIPPRLEIRKNAPVEFPHIMMLYDDEKNEIAESLYNRRNEFVKLYDFELNMGGGHIEGYFIKDYKMVDKMFSNLLDSNRLIDKYGIDDKFAFAVGDGNHSLATAKTHWENIKKGLTNEQIKTHPAKYALAEFNNVYDDGIYFEPIYRFVCGIDVEKFTNYILSVDGKFSVYKDESETQSKKEVSLPATIKNVDEKIKNYIESNGGSVDYIHGLVNLKELVKNTKNAVGIIFDKLDKNDLFKYVEKYGALPRKTFSMGEGVEKRYYLEGRKII